MEPRSLLFHAHDNAAAASLRFAVEVIAWVAGPWAAAGVSIWLAIPVAVVLVGLPAVFSTKGDKAKVVVATPGPVRVLIELVLHAVALGAPWLVWPAYAAVATSAAVALALALGSRRLVWLMGGAPLDEGSG
jgi:hypothetical protein